MARKAKDTPHLRLRVESALLERLEEAAAKNNRTLTGEITRRLEQSFINELVKDTARAAAFDAVQYWLQLQIKTPQVQPPTTKPNKKEKAE